MYGRSPTGIQLPWWAFRRLFELYSILNRQYSAREYAELVPQVVVLMKRHGEWGEWFPPGAAPHYYHKSLVDQSLEPIPLAEAARRGYRLGADASEIAQVGALAASELPEQLTADSIPKLLGTPILCERTGRPFNLQRLELQLYLRSGVPLPGLHWRERMNDALSVRSRIPAV